MTIVKHELRQGRTAFAVWTASVISLLVLCLILFPDIKGEMDNVGDMFASMGNFTAAFGMDRLNFGTLLGFYAIECGNIVGLGGAFYAALTAVSVLSKEEKDKTAEFLLSHPVSRGRILTEKLASSVILILAMNALTLLSAILSIYAIGEEVPWKEFLLLHAGFLIMQLELCGICFGLSAFLRKGSAGIGLGLAIFAYFLNIVANMTESVEWLKIVTPFGYCDSAEIISDGSLNGARIAVGCLTAAVFTAAGFRKYIRKDIR